MQHRGVFIDDRFEAARQLEDAVRKWSTEHRNGRTWVFHGVHEDTILDLGTGLLKGRGSRPPNVHYGALFVSLDAMIPGVHGAGIWDLFAPQYLWNGAAGPQFGALALHSIGYAGYAADHPGSVEFAAAQLRVAERFRAARDAALKIRAPGTPPAHGNEAAPEFRHVFRCAWVDGVEPAVDAQTAFAAWANMLADIAEGIKTDPNRDLIDFYV